MSESDKEELDWVLQAPRREDLSRPLGVYRAAFDFEGRYLLLFGGSGSGKSHFAAQKCLYRATSEKGHRLLVLRKVKDTIRKSTFERFKKIIESAEIKARALETSMDVRLEHSEIWHAGLDDVERLKSIEDPTSMWVEEATELNWTEGEADDFANLDLRMRGTSPSYKQAILAFNPTSRAEMIFERFGVDVDQVPEHGAYVSADGQVMALHTTYLDNPFAGEEYVEPFRKLSGAMREVYEFGHLADTDQPDQLITNEMFRRACETDPRRAIAAGGGLRRLGGDIAWTGSDKSALAYLHGYHLERLDLFDGQDPTRTGDLVKRAIVEQGYGADLTAIDDIGMGATVKSNLWNDGFDVAGFTAGASPVYWREGMPVDMREMTFTNLRDQAWWFLRCLMEEGRFTIGDLASDVLRLLKQDLLAPRYRYKTKGHVEVEPKQGTQSWGIRPRLGRSTDPGDSVVMGLFAEFLGHQTDYSRI